MSQYATGRPHRRPSRIRRFDHGQPISKIDTRPMVFVTALLVIIITVVRYDAHAFSPDVELPIAIAEPVHHLDKAFLVTVTTTDVESGASPRDRPPSSDFSECRAYLGNGTPVGGYELYDYAFILLDSTFLGGAGVEFVIEEPDSVEEAIPTFYVRADKTVPWRCVGGAISNLERAGYPTVGLLTAPIG